jgi:hypothetical protein
MSLDVETGSVTSDVQFINIELKTEDAEGMEEATESSNVYEQDECVICLESLDDPSNHDTISFHCGHDFHVSCTKKYILSLFEKKADISCPICRFVECYAHSPEYAKMKRIFGITEPQLIHPYPHLAIEIRATNIEVAQPQPTRRNIQIDPRICNRIFGLLICLVFTFLIIFLAVAVSTTIQDRKKLNNYHT